MLCEEKKCTGCFACQNACPKKCIELLPDNKGHIYPKINAGQCINCGLCNKACPSLNSPDFLPPKTAYAAWANEESERFTSSSGGVASVFSRYILENGGVVFGSVVQKNLKVEHVMIDCECEISKLKGSKYVHSHIKDSYCKVKEKLELDVLVLFIGTPCQIAGLKKFLIKDYKNLFTIDIICHGVPSQKMLLDEIGDKQVDFFTFRDQTGFNFTLYRNGKVVSKKSMYKSPYLLSFMKSITYRESCYSCPYARSDRVSDITIGDFWGLGDLKTERKNVEKGISLLLPITDKGMYLIEQCKNEMFLEERKVSEAISGNDQLRHPSDKNDANYIFNKFYPTSSFEFSVKKATNYYSLKNICLRVIGRNQMLLNKMRVVKRKILK